MQVAAPSLAPEIRLRFRFGDWCFHVHRFSGSAQSEHFTRITPEMPITPDRLDPGADALFLPSRPVLGRLPTLHGTPNIIRYVPAQYSRYYIDIAGDFQSWLQGLSHQCQRELRRKLRRFAESSGAAPLLREYRSPREMTEFHRVARAVSARSYQERLGTGLPATKEFLDELIALADAEGARGFILFHRDRPVAYELCQADGDCLSGEYCGYDPEFRRLSPGVVLLYCVLERLFAERDFRIFDFGRGEAAYKATFATGSTFCADIYYFRRTGANLFLVCAHRAVRAVWSAIAKMLEFFGIKRRLRNFVRT